MHCPYCDQEHADGVRFCPSTGQELVRATYCTNCRTEIEMSWKVCPTCGKPVNETIRPKSATNQRFRKSAQFQKRTLYLLVTSFVLLGIAYLIFEQQSGTPETPVDVVTLSPPLENVEFPNQEVPYPSDWPRELYYPEQFTVVELSSGALPESTAIGWGAKLRYAGDPKTAASVLSSFFTDHAWQIVEQTDLDTGGVVLVIKRGSDASGVVVIDADVSNTNNTIIVATIFP